MPYAILNVQKVKSSGSVAGLARHLDRTTTSPNVDPERSHLNRAIIAPPDVAAAVRARIATAPNVRRDSVHVLAHVLSASPEWWEGKTEAEVRAWAHASTRWLGDEYGRENVVSVTLHRDEATPHLHALVVPIDERGRLNAKRWTGGRERLRALHDGYSEAMAPFKLERGERGGGMRYDLLAERYRAITGAPPEAADVMARVNVAPPPHVVPHPTTWAEDQSQAIAARVSPLVCALALHLREAERRAEAAEAHAEALATLLREAGGPRRTPGGRGTKAGGGPTRSPEEETPLERIGRRIDERERGQRARR